ESVIGCSACSCNSTLPVEREILTFEISTLSSLSSGIFEAARTFTGEPEFPTGTHCNACAPPIAPTNISAAAFQPGRKAIPLRAHAKNCQPSSSALGAESSSSASENSLRHCESKTPEESNLSAA